MRACPRRRGLIGLARHDSRRTTSLRRAPGAPVHARGPDAGLAPRSRSLRDAGRADLRLRQGARRARSRRGRGPRAAHARSLHRRRAGGLPDADRPAGGRDHGRLDHPRGRPQLPARRPPDGRARTSAATWSSAAAASGSWRPRTSAPTSPIARTRSAMHAVDALAAAPPWPEDPAGYMRRRGRPPGSASLPGGESLAIPTWVTAGEPISLFASHIAKYFSNSIREDGLLAVATAGIVFAPGGAGTMQEIFQDGAQNAYRVFGRSPMAFLDSAALLRGDRPLPGVAAAGGAAGLRRPPERRRRARGDPGALPRRPARAARRRHAGDARQAHAQRALTRRSAGRRARDEHRRDDLPQRVLGAVGGHRLEQEAGRPLRDLLDVPDRRRERR